MNYFQDRDDHSVFYVAVAFAKQTTIYERFGIHDRRYAVHGYGENVPSSNFITVCIGFERGMTDSGRDCWSEHAPTLFKTLEEAQQMAKAPIGGGYNFSLIPNTIKFYKVYKRNIVKHFVEEV